MPHDVTQAFLTPGVTLRFQDRNDLLESLDRLERPVPPRHQGRTTDDRESFCIVRYLRFLAMEELLPTPVTLRRPPKQQDPPDFVLEWPDGGRETFELTEGSTEEYQKRLTAASREKRGLTLPVDINTRAREAAPLWADTLFSAFLKKAKALRDGRYNLDHLLLYDLTGPGLLVPLELGAPLLKAKLEDWLTGENPSHRFGRISVLRDLALLLDVGGRSQVLRGRSQRFRLPVLRARDEEDLKRRLRELDLYCRQSFIRHLRAFGSILGNLDELADDNGLGLPVFREESDLDLLVELEPGTRVTLLDMARMERELGDLIGFKVDLRTAEDLSRYFRAEVQREAVELRATA